MDLLEIYMGFRQSENEAKRLYGERNNVSEGGHVRKHPCSFRNSAG